MPDPAVILKKIAHGSEAYRQTVALRDAVLRKPLGLAFDDQQLAEESDSLHLTAWRGEELVGCVVLTPLNDHDIRLRQLAVQPHCRGRGIGAALVRFSEALARQHGFGEMILHARREVVGFYQQFGYRCEGEPYIEMSIPHQTMRKHLGN